MTEVYAFECGIKGWPTEGGNTIVNAASRGQAKSEFLRDLDMPEVKFTHIFARKVGRAVTSDQFIRNANYRGMPDLRCGDSVKVGDSDGIIVGHDSSANIEVLFSTGRYSGKRLSVHPSELKIEPNKSDSPNPDFTPGMPNSHYYHPWSTAKGGMVRTVKPLRRGDF